ncbi:LysR family transcriptional regulator [Devosia sp. MC1541]|uniref:LysR family transcriptional regulator n=1 Tax=Devosia sp. MC1541 TaxID=2725264 RepID=UPI00145CF676|nr:LysR family transcriptional regulator [Devosia sp. MC1541]
MDDRQLRFIYTVIESKGVRNAAETLDLDPSVISRTISSLEKSLGMALFQRLGRTMEPTEAALLLHDFYRESLLSHAQLTAKLDDLKGLRSGKISIGVSEGFIDELFNGPIGIFRERHPGIRIELNHGSVENISKLVAQSELDIGLTHNAPPQDGALVHSRRAMPIELITLPDHPFALRGTKVSVEELTTIPLALVNSGYGLRRAVDVLEFTHRVQLRPVFTTNGLAGLRAFVLHNCGCTLLSPITVKPELEAGLLKATPIDTAIFSMTDAQILIRKGRRLPPAAAEMLSLMTLHLNMASLPKSSTAGKNESIEI